MHAFFDISSDDIARLDDTQLREVIARLCQAEMRKANLSPAYVTWDGDQRASDGGIDVMVSIPSALSQGGWIPTPITGIQVKAEDMPPGKIPGEMFPNGAVRPAFVELQKAGGTYIIASSMASVSDRRLRERRQAMREAANAHGLTTMHVAYYGRRSIADWINENPALTPWIRELVGRTSQGWKSYGAWAYMEADTQSPYLEDRDVKGVAPGEDEGVTALALIERMREALRKPGKCLRLTGLSGVGKTRLVQALFEEAVITGQLPLDRDAVLYADEGEAVSPQPPQMIEQLVADKRRMVVIVDNCSSTLHERLVQQIRIPGCLLSLLTVEYDIREDLSVETQAYRLEPGSDRLIESLVEKRFPHLFNSDVEKIVEFSGGNARVAIVLASTADTGGELAQLKHDDLFIRLFQQRHDPDADLLACATAVSLVYSFDGVDETHAQTELSVLTGLAELSRIKMRGALNELERRGLLQKRGNWRAVLPHAIANRLATRAIANFPPDILWEKLVIANPRLTRSFSRRLSYLHESAAAIAFARNWLAQGNGLDNLETLSDFERDVFCNLAPLQPGRVLSLIGQATKSDAFVSTRNYDRSRYTAVVRNIAHDAAFFESAVQILASFAQAEEDGFNNHPARTMLRRLFQIQFSGSEATLGQRVAVIETFLTSAELKERRLGLSFLEAALTTRIRRDLPCDFGARRLGPGYHPKTEDEFSDWFGAFLQLAVKLGSEKNQLGISLRKRIGDAFSDLWEYPEVWKHLEAVGDHFYAVDGWPEGWLGAKAAMYYRSRTMPDEGRHRLKRLEEKLRPNSLMTKVRAQVFGARNLNAIDVDETTQNAENYSQRIEEWYRRSEELGRLVAMDEACLDEALPFIFQQTSYNTGAAFSRGIGQSYPDPQGLLDKIRGVYRDTDKRKIQLYALGNLMRALGDRDAPSVNAFLDMATTDPLWADTFPVLQGYFVLDETAIERCVRTIERTTGAVGQYGSLAHSQRDLDVGHIGRLLEALMEKADGFLPALNILFWATDDHQHALRPLEDMQRLVIKFLSEMSLNVLADKDTSDLRHLIDLVIFAFTDDTEIDVAAKIAEGYARWRTDTYIHVWFDKSLLGELFGVFGTRLLDKLLETGILSSSEGALAVLGRYSRYDTPALPALDPVDVIAWCKLDPTIRFGLIASVGEFFAKLSDEDQLDVSENWTPLGLLMLEHAPDKAKLIETLTDRAHPRSGGSGIADLMRERAKLILRAGENGEPDVQSAAKLGHSQLLADADHWARFFNDNEQRRNATFE